MPVDDQLRQKLVELRNRIWQSAFDAGYSAALETLLELSETPEKEVASPASSADTKPKKARTTPTGPRMSGNNVRNLILDFVTDASREVTAGEFSRRYPHISSSTRYTAARQLAEEGLIARDNDRWSPRAKTVENANNRLDHQNGFTDRLQQHETSNLQGNQGS